MSNCTHSAFLKAEEVKKDEKKEDRPKSPSILAKLLAPFKGDKAEKVKKVKTPKSPKKDKKKEESEVLHTSSC